ncbi:FeoB-associated Cys-rich membrane protein [Desulfobotulus mexicanus]|uniref:FeoB-associated Cys-rich membrane protein n=1 Tax=Desulfobotulus mexicanus TaxID=2586642 RepID=A0A5Q4VE12_9BACT|nr:FeoB-associated Cys-rich membrane protein [Desulfobotulus mexicanus]TYT75178.1 FeoB-associated Cys-rich membrane protein [Desulfobotulus mexicanus]
MFLEYFILTVIVAWAVFYLWHLFFRKKGCSCDSCPSAQNASCTAEKLGIICPEKNTDQEKADESEGKNMDKN